MSGLLSLLNSLGPIGQFLAGLAAFLGVTSGFFLWLRRWLTHASTHITQATSAQIQCFIAEQLSEAAAAADPASFYTLDVNLENGLTMAVPMFPFREMIVSENIRMAVIHHSGESTTLLLRCPGVGHLQRHFHASTCETIEVRSGHVTHIETGRRYGPGETWIIPQGEIHSALFENCCLLIVHKPPLPTAAQVPVNLAAMRAVFPEN